MLQSTGSQRVRHDGTTRQQQRATVQQSRFSGKGLVNRQRRHRQLTEEIGSLGSDYLEGPCPYLAQSLITTGNLKSGKVASTLVGVGEGCWRQKFAITQRKAEHIHYGHVLLSNLESSSATVTESRSKCGPKMGVPVLVLDPSQQGSQVFLLLRVLFPSEKESESQTYATLCNPMDYPVHGILQARILEWVACPPSRGSSQPRD